jgi:hypothetical protein
VGDYVLRANDSARTPRASRLKKTRLYVKNHIENKSTDSST